MVILDLFLYIILGLSVFCLIRVIIGPTVADRMVAIDIFGILVVGVCAIFAIKYGKGFIVDIALAWMIFSFIGTLALAKYLEGAKFDD